MQQDQMVTCPWCGTNYVRFQANCNNCGGPLPFPTQDSVRLSADLATPPPAPRDLNTRTIWRTLLTDGWAIVAGVFILLGTIFGLVGAGLTVTLVAAFVGLPFLGLGVLFLAPAVPMALWRYDGARRTVDVLRLGDAAQGRIAEVYENRFVRVNHRHPWVISYSFQVDGHTYEGKATTLRTPNQRQQPNQPVVVLYLPQEPSQNTIYPPIM